MKIVKKDEKYKEKIMIFFYMNCLNIFIYGYFVRNKVTLEISNL